MSEFTKRKPGDVYVNEDFMMRKQLWLVLAVKSLPSGGQTLTLLTANGIETIINEKQRIEGQLTTSWIDNLHIGSDGLIRRKYWLR